MKETGNIRPEMPMTDNSNTQTAGLILDFVGRCLDVFATQPQDHRDLVTDMLDTGRRFQADPQMQIGTCPPQAPVAKWLEPALAQGRKSARENGAMLGLLEATERLASLLPWEVGYDDPSLSESFRDNFGYAVVVGPGGLAECDQIAAGVTMMGPGLFYDWHHHPAHEFYINLSQDARWGLDFAELTLRPFGEAIVHPGGHPHAMQSGEGPLLAPWLWCGDVHSPAKMFAES